MQKSDFELRTLHLFKQLAQLIVIRDIIEVADVWTLGSLFLDTYSV
jgi:hypothetical protein